MGPPIYHFKCTKMPNLYWNMPTLLNSSKVDPSNWKTKNKKQQPNKKIKKIWKINVKILEKPLRYWEMARPIYETQMYQKAVPIKKTYHYCSKISKLVLSTENVKSLQKKSRKSKKIKILEQPLTYWKMVPPICHIQLHQNAPPTVKHAETTQS